MQPQDCIYMRKVVAIRAKQDPENVLLVGILVQVAGGRVHGTRTPTLIATKVQVAARSRESVAVAVVARYSSTECSNMCLTHCLDLFYKKMLLVLRCS